MADAQHTAGFPIKLPAALGPPDLVFYRSLPVPLVTLVYSPRPDLPAGSDPEVGALFMEFRSSATSKDYIQKMLGRETTIQEVSVSGVTGLWLEGKPHAVLIAPSPATGELVSEDIRLAGNTLLWYRDGVTYRLEANLSQEHAVQIAGTAG